MGSEEDLFTRAQTGDRAAVRAVLCNVHPSLHRLAAMLAGEHERADRVVDLVVRSGLRGLDQWSGWGDPETWFIHQIVLVARRICGEGRPDSSEDLLATAPAAPTSSPAYLAFVRGIRRLPRQQLEAFILHHAERLNTRLMGVSMDCSTQAAQTHLNAADNAMKLLTDDLPTMASAVRNAGRSLSPTGEQTERFVDQQMSEWAGYIRAKRQRRLVILTGLLLVLGIAAWFGWKLLYS